MVLINQYFGNLINEIIQSDGMYNVNENICNFSCLVCYDM